MKKRSLILIMTVLFLLPTLLTGCLKAEPKTFTVRNMSITLTEDFYISEYTAGFDACIESDDDIVMMQWLDFDTHLPSYINASTSMSECVEYVKDELNESSATVQYSEGGVPYFFYEGELLGFLNVTFLVTVHKSADELWIIQFSSIGDSMDDKLEEFLTYADSVTFS